MNADRETGFTLLEVLVAMVVATLGLLAVTLTTLTATRNASTLRERTIAHWVAMNVASEIRLSGQFPDIGASDGDAEFADVEWRWEADVSSTDIEGLRRVEISVAYAQTPDDAVADLIAFVGKPSPGVRYREWTGTVIGAPPSRQP